MLLVRLGCVMLSSAAAAEMLRRCATRRKYSSWRRSMMRIVAGPLDVDHQPHPIPHGPALEDRAVPRAAADRTFVDQPGVDTFAVGIDPDLVTAAEASGLAASAAAEPRLGGGTRNDGPLNT